MKIKKKYILFSSVQNLSYMSIILGEKENLSILPKVKLLQEISSVHNAVKPKINKSNNKLPPVPRN